MLGFIRKIREHLSSGKNIRKSVLNILGEIALIVIGIVIALQFDAWSEARSDAEDEEKYMHRIAQDLHEQLDYIQLQKKFEYSVISNGRLLLRRYQSDSSFQVDNEFTQAIGALMLRNTFIRTDPTYTEMVSSGKLDLLDNDSLKFALASYYDNLKRIEEIISKNNSEFTDARMVPIVLRLTASDRTSNLNSLPSDTSYQAGMKLAFSSVTNDRLLSTSRNQLAIPENELLLLNAVSFRCDLATIHYNCLIELEAKTTKLIELTESILRQLKL